MAQSEAKERMNKWLKEHGQSSSSSASVRHRSKPNVNNESKKIAAENSRLRAEVRQMKIKQGNEEEKKRKAREDKKANRDDEAIHHMEQGSNHYPDFSDRFDKTYHLHYITRNGKKKPYALHFIIRPATLADQGDINNEVTYLTNRLGKYYEINNFNLIKAFATIRVLGIKVPSAFRNPDKLYRIDLLEMVYLDFLRWEGNFRRHSMA